MEQITVKSIVFYTYYEGDNDRYMDVGLSTNRLDERFRLRIKPGNLLDLSIVDYEHVEREVTPTDAECSVLLLVMCCCADYLLGRGKESLSTFQLAKIGELSGRFDWEGAGYGPEGEPGERAAELADHIAHFWSIG